MTEFRGPVVVMAGSGRLPVQLVEHLERTGRDFRVLAFKGYAAAPLRRKAHAVVDLLDLGTMRRQLEQWAPGAVTVVGAIRRPSANRLLKAYSGISATQTAIEGAARGDDKMFSGALTILEGWGHPVLGAHEISPDLLAGPEFKSSIAVDDRAREAIDVGLRLLTTLSPYDMGQATVVSGQRVLAIEGPEGTDRMLKRVRGINQVHFFRKKRNGGVLIKTAKMGQDLRVDMPTIGPRTVIEAARAGLGGIAVGAGSTIVLDRSETLSRAERLGLFLTTVELSWLQGRS